MTPCNGFIYCEQRDGCPGSVCMYSFDETKPCLSLLGNPRIGLQSAGGACLELYDGQSNELICASCPVVGSVAPAEGGPPVSFVAAMTRTELSPPRPLRPDQPLRLLSKYNASEGHSGAYPLPYFVHVLHGEMRSKVGSRSRMWCLKKEEL